MKREITRLTRTAGFLVGTLTIDVLLAASADHAEHGAAAAGGLGDQIKQIVATGGLGIIAFLIVFFILWKKLFPPIVAALDKREQSIRDSLEAAERAKDEAQALIARHEDQLEKARAESRAIIEEGKADAEKVKQGIIDSAGKEAKDISDRARRDIELAKKSAVDDLYRQASKLSFEIAEKVIEKNLSPQDHQGLVDSCIAEYEKGSE